MYSAPARFMRRSRQAAPLFQDDQCLPIDVESLGMQRAKEIARQREREAIWDCDWGAGLGTGCPTAHANREQELLWQALLGKGCPKARAKQEQELLWQALLGGMLPKTRTNQELLFREKCREDHRNQPLLPADGEDGVIAAWASSGGVDEDVDGLVGYGRRRQLGEHDVQVDRPEDLLQGVEGQPTQFAFDEIWPVLHNGLEFEVPITALPARDQVQHVGALRRLAVFSALGAGEGDAERGEHGEVGGLVAHPEEPREEVDLAGDGGDGQQARGPDDEEREYCFVCEGGVDVGRLLEDDDVAACPLGR